MLTLSSSQHTFTITLDAEVLCKTGRKSKRITARNPDTRELLSFDIITLTGNCNWRVFENYRGGRYGNIIQKGVSMPGWNVKRVGLETQAKCSILSSGMKK